MIFNTLAFAKFFVFVFVVSWLLTSWPKARFYFLTIASYVFYSGLDVFTAAFWQAMTTLGPWAALKANAPLLEFVPIVFIGSTVDYFLSIWIDDAQDPVKRKRLVYVTIAMNTGLLLVFKYWDFLAEQVMALGGADYRLNLPLPVGISFFTFMSLSYVVDVYRRAIPPSRNYAHYITYIAFFPHLVAGPIIRGRDLLPLFAQRVQLTAAAASEGMFLVAIGLFKKVVVSDYLRLNLVDRVVAEPTSYSSVEVLVGMFGYAIQIYCDFSGYSDVAIGAALLLGYRLKINFDAPFKASNLVEFWRRWHISLSSWLRDYVYIPLGGSRIVRKDEPTAAARRRLLSRALLVLGIAGTIWRAVAAVLDSDPSRKTSNLLSFLGAALLLLFALYLADQGRKYVNVWVTMVVCGIWHGAAWSYVLFGVVQGLAVGVSHYYFDWRGVRPGDAGDAGLKPAKILSVIVTFVFTTFTFVLIRAPLDKALLIYKQLFQLSTFTPNLTKTLLLFIFGGLVLQWMPRRAYETARDVFVRAPAPVQAAALFVLAVILREAASAEALPFVYGQF
ncbi:MAG: MBOAT family protein [Polyangiaceae bacterium]|nr:MBOAT family protein [Polyangiaceae bacterium]